MPHPHLRPGDLVAVLAPAGPTPAEFVARVEALYAAQGLRARLYPSCHATDEHAAYLAGPDAARAADLHAALADPEVAAIHCQRGGYGAMRLLPLLDAGLVRRAAKLLIGYSDITALHALWAREGLASLHAPMPGSDLVRPGPGHAADAAVLWQLLRAPLAAASVLAPALPAGALRQGGRAQGPLIGGNLSLVAALLGTPWAWKLDPAPILFLEDIHEEPYRVDRLLTQLRLAGVLDAAAGFVLGHFTHDDPADTLLARELLPLGKPLLAGWPAGHAHPNHPLPLGLRVALDAGAGTLTLLDDFLA